MSYDLSGFTSQKELQVPKNTSLETKSDLEFKLSALARKQTELAADSSDLVAELSDARLKASSHAAYTAQITDESKKASAAFDLKEYNFEVDKIQEKIRLKGPAVVLARNMQAKHLQFMLDDHIQLLADIDVLMPTLPPGE